MFFEQDIHLESTQEEIGAIAYVNAIGKSLKRQWANSSLEELET